MIIERTFYGLRCDNCKEQFITDSDYSYFEQSDIVSDEAEEYGWHIGKQKNEVDLCDQCHSFDDEDNLIINTERKK